ncbi:hypothetical protein FB567DRAFT_434719 [Paraphoma chrysanthemicola]|uniref:Small ribosomal subunit protein mS38 n=1 Tax=Paraphoma chrysanthemicola TaxID=798071 RepID=A0A8K0RFF3_9PLEO|nr:hypothetical protein FB567DRAFT_434719 [Paraphoma chrysanthemicola]
MFTPSFARVARSTPSLSAAPAGAVCRAALCTAPKPFRPSHQRRYSSSKSSIPPSSKKKPAEDLEQSNAPTQLQGQGTNAKASDTITEIPVSSSMNNVPHVPATTHIHDADVKLSSFFALHRPIPFHREAWQQPATMDVFEALFHRTEPADPRSIQRTNQTLSDFVQSLYAGIDAHEEMQEHAVFVQETTQHLDGPPTEESINFYASQIPHFHPPPAPVAFDPFALNQRITEVPLPTERIERSTTFREHVRRRRGGMLLISVKRQRKLKMKKHKYKKLMKRTRLLRRKLDRT